MVVVSATPEGLFEASAIAAFGKAKFSPGRYLGIPVRSPDHHRGGLHADRPRQRRVGAGRWLGREALELLEAGCTD